MRRFPIIFLQLALGVFITSRYAIGIPTRSQVRQLITMILYEDELYNDVLSEKVILDKSDSLPPWIDEIVKDLNNVDPLQALLALSSPHEHYSGYNLNLSETILGKSLLCLMYKRVAFHLSLIIGLLQKRDNWVRFKTRATIFTYVIPFYIDMLYVIYKKYDHLLNLYNKLNGMVSTLDTAGNTVNENYIRTLKTELEILINVIKSSCVVSEMKQYCSSFQLKDLKDCDTKINDENIVSNLDVEMSIKTLMENENAILNLYDEMDLFRSMQMDTWKVWLNIPDFPEPTETEVFIRTPLPKYRNEVQIIIDTRNVEIEKEDASTEIHVEVETDTAEEKKSSTDSHSEASSSGTS